jgi:hypothetical protein
VRIVDAAPETSNRLPQEVCIADSRSCARQHHCNVLGGAGDLSMATQSQYRDHRACGALIGPGAMTPPQVRYWEAIIGKVAAQDEWMRELDKNGLTPSYMNSDGTRRLFTQQEEQLRTILTELGLAK